MYTIYNKMTKMKLQKFENDPVRRIKSEVRFIT